MKVSCIRRALVAFFAGALMSSGMYAAVVDLPVTSIGGVKCYYYEVQKGESIYQVSVKLGVTREQITEHNPSAADGLKPKMRLYFPMSKFSTDGGAVTVDVAQNSAAGVATHVVKKGETLYGVARKYGMTADDLIKLNPQAENGIKTGDVLRITSAEPAAEAAETESVVTDASGNRVHVIKSGETLFSIANKNGVTLEELLAVNPKLDPMRYKSGDSVIIPASKNVAEDADAPEEETISAAVIQPAQQVVAVVDEDAEANEDDVEDVEVEFAEEGKEIGAEQPSDADPVIPITVGDAVEEVVEGEEVVEQELDSMNVAVMLPFMLNEPVQTRTTQLYTEFFKGMLMAADTMRNSSGAPVKFHFYDTAANSDTVKALLNRPEIGAMDMVVAPDNSEHLTAIVNAVDPETLVLNIFAVKDETYKTHRNLIQTNIPHHAMYARAIDGFMNKYTDVMPVFISRNGGLADKDSFVSALKERLNQENREYREVVFNASLSDDDLMYINPNDTALVFVPNSGSKTEFAKFVQAMTNMRNNVAAKPENVTVFGYPEWVTFRGESFDEICALDATIYSRFLVDESDAETRNLKSHYKTLYGVDMYEAVPTQGILGYDIGRFIIEGLRELQETGAFPHEYNGVQNSMRLGWSGVTSADAVSGETQSNGGLVNEALIFINYTPLGGVESVVL